MSSVNKDELRKQKSVLALACVIELSKRTMYNLNKRTDLALEKRSTAEVESVIFENVNNEIRGRM